MITALLSLAFLLIGVFGGWFAAEKYMAFVALSMEEPHIYEDLFQENPHPEIFDENGEINRGEYMYIEFPPGFDPKDMTDYYIGEIDSDEDED